MSNKQHRCAPLTKTQQYMLGSRMTLLRSRAARRLLTEDISFAKALSEEITKERRRILCCDCGQPESDDEDDRPRSLLQADRTRGSDKQEAQLIPRDAQTAKNPTRPPVFSTTQVHPSAKDTHESSRAPVSDQAPGELDLKLLDSLVYFKTVPYTNFVALTDLKFNDAWLDARMDTLRAMFTPGQDISVRRVLDALFNSVDDKPAAERAKDINAVRQSVGNYIEAYGNNEHISLHALLSPLLNATQRDKLDRKVIHTPAPPRQVDPIQQVETSLSVLRNAVFARYINASDFNFKPGVRFGNQLHDVIFDRLAKLFAKERIVNADRVVDAMYSNTQMHYDFTGRAILDSITRLTTAIRNMPSHSTAIRLDVFLEAVGLNFEKLAPHRLPPLESATKPDAPKKPAAPQPNPTLQEKIRSAFDSLMIASGGLEISTDVIHKLANFKFNNPWVDEVLAYLAKVVRTTKSKTVTVNDVIRPLFHSVYTPADSAELLDKMTRTVKTIQTSIPNASNVIDITQILKVILSREQFRMYEAAVAQHPTLTWVNGLRDEIAKTTNGKEQLARIESVGGETQTKMPPQRMSDKPKESTQVPSAAPIVTNQETSQDKFIRIAKTRFVNIDECEARSGVLFDASKSSGQLINARLSRLCHRAGRVSMHDVICVITGNDWTHVRIADLNAQLDSRDVITLQQILQYVLPPETFALYIKQQPVPKGSGNSVKDTPPVNLSPDRAALTLVKILDRNSVTVYSNALPQIKEEAPNQYVNPSIKDYASFVDGFVNGMAEQRWTKNDTQNTYTIPAKNIASCVYQALPLDTSKLDLLSEPLNEACRRFHDQNESIDLKNFMTTIFDNDVYRLIMAKFK